MTRKTLAPLLTFVAAMLSVAGCGGGGLVVGGNAIVTDASGTSTGFRFPSGVHLNGGMGTNSGACTISRGAAGVYGVVVDLYGDSQGTGHAVRSMSIMAHSDAPDAGDIMADLGGTEYSGTCRVDLTAIDETRGSVTITANDCPLTHATETVSADVLLTFSACTVI